MFFVVASLTWILVCDERTPISCFAKLYLSAQRLSFNRVRNVLTASIAFSWIHETFAAFERNVLRNLRTRQRERERSWDNMAFPIFFCSRNSPRQKSWLIDLESQSVYFINKYILIMTMQVCKVEQWLLLLHTLEIEYSISDLWRDY